VRGYETLRVVDPLRLWRLACVALWWTRCVRGESLATHARPVALAGAASAVPS
jgi:hypothetical protein